jgi:O-antigen/teichoic acid export membrane protein
MNTKTVKGLIFGLFTRGHERTRLAKKNIAISFIIRGLNIAVGLALVPLAISYLDPTKYGIWITLSSIIGWFGFFDIGLGHGLRNKFAEALARGDIELARIYVSTTYAILSIIVTVVLVVFYTFSNLLNWSVILNVSDNAGLQEELNILALAVFTFFCLRFIFKLISTILTADQRPAKAAFFDLLSNAIALVAIYILTKTTDESLIYLGIVISGTPVLVLMMSSIWFFNRKYSAYRPSLKYVEFSKAPSLLGLGIKFFTLQITGVLLFKTNNIIISQLFGPAQVTPYYIAFKYFSLLMMFFSIVISPFWSAFTEAWIKNEILWIENAIKKLIGLWVVLVFVGFLMLLSSKHMYGLWIGEEITIHYTVSSLVAIWTLINAWNAIFSNLLNGLGKIKLQLYIAIATSLLNVPLAIYLGLLLGIEGVLIANIILAVLAAWVYPIQYKKIITNNDKGIWGK